MMALDIMTPSAREIAMRPRMDCILRHMISVDRYQIMAASARAVSAEYEGYEGSATRERRSVQYWRRCLAADLALAEAFHGPKNQPMEDTP